MTNNLLKGKRGVIFGALDDKSIAWKVAERCVEEGAKVTLTNAPVAMLSVALSPDVESWARHSTRSGNHFIAVSAAALRDMPGELITEFVVMIVFCG